MAYVSDDKGEMGIHTPKIKNKEFRLQRQKHMKFVKERNVFHIFLLLFNKVCFLKCRTFQKHETISWD